MRHMILYVLIAVGAVSLGTIGFANTLTVSGLNPIGGNDGLITSPTLGTITAVTWNEIETADGDIEIDTADVTVNNGDSVAHTYQLCAVLSDGTAATSGLGCQLTGSILATSSGIFNVDFVPDFDTIIATNIYITLEELS